TDDRKHHALVVAPRAAGPGFGEADPRNRSEKVDAPRGKTDLENDAGLGEIGLGELRQRSAEFTQRRVGLPRVLRRRLHPYVQIAGRARVTMNGERVRAHNHESHLSGDERAQQIAKVLVQAASPHSEGSTVPS